MKHTTRILALLLALVLCLGLSVTAFATEGEKGTITINQAVNGQTYTIYRILELESYSTENQAYSYKAAEGWSDFIETGAGSKYFTVDTQKYVTWKKGVAEGQAAELAKEALTYAQDNSIGNQGTATGANNTATFTNLPLGYYLVDSTVGTLCALGTTNSSVTVEDKHTAPSIEKQVKGNSTDNNDKVNDASIGDTVNFKVTIDAKKGAQNYVFHDTMSTGLTFDGTVVVKKGATEDAATEVGAEGNYTVKIKQTNPDVTDDCTFEVAFTESFCNGLTNADKIYITYSATLNSQAVIAGEGNSNTGKLKYGENKDLETNPSTTKTYTWDFEVFKFGNGDQTKGLKGAQFVVLSQDKQKVAKVANDKITGWDSVTTDEYATAWPEGKGTILITGDNGKINVKGLDAGTYYLHEVKAPDGYNKLKDDEEFTIDRQMNETGTSMSYTKLTVKVDNLSGTILPSTGGMGTTIFYVLGGILAVGAAVLLVTKKRMERG